jgi:ribosome-associated heat shock protein Hsp15
VSEVRVRLDRWLWAARFFKTRALAKAAVEGGKVHVDGNRSKAAKEVMPGQTLEIRRGWDELTVVVEGLSVRRGNATQAQKLYRETPESIERRELERSRRQMQRAGLKIPQIKPGKRDRRELRKLKATQPDPAADLPSGPQGSCAESTTDDSNPDRSED